MSLIYRHDDGEMIKMKHMTINGIGGKVHYWISRPNNNPKGALVFTHGLTANHTMYERQVKYFKNDYVVITWDVPLHGLSIPYKEFSYEITARDLNSILLQESIGKVCLIGMSMGGYPSQMFAYLYPEKVQCFVGIDTTPFRTEYYSKSDLWWLSKVKTMAEWFTDKTLRKSMAKSVAVTDYSYNKMIEMLKPTLPEDIPYVFISSVSGMGIQQLKDLLWTELNKESNQLESLRRDAIVHRPKDMSKLQQELQDLGEDEDFEYEYEEDEDDEDFVENPNADA